MILSIKISPWLWRCKHGTINYQYYTIPLSQNNPTFGPAWWCHLGPGEFPQVLLQASHSLVHKWLASSDPPPTVLDAGWTLGRRSWAQLKYETPPLFTLTYVMVESPKWSWKERSRDVGFNLDTQHKASSCGPTVTGGISALLPMEARTWEHPAYP